MSTISGQIRLEVIAAEEFTTAEVPGAGTVSERTLRTGRGNLTSLALNATSTPKVDAAPISKKITLGGSPTVLDLTAIAAAAIPADATRTVDLTGKKLVSYSLRGDDGNDDPILVGPGASSNTYDLFGSGVEIPVEPGQHIAASFRIASSLPTVAGGAKNIEISGTSGDILYIDMLFGTP